MDLDDLGPVKKKRAELVLGEELLRFSLADLETRLQQLADERNRVEAEIAARGSHRSAAEALFKR